MLSDGMNDGLLLTGLGLVTAFVVLGLLFSIITIVGWITRLMAARKKAPGPLTETSGPATAESIEAKKIAAAIGVALAMRQAESHRSEEPPPGKKWRAGRPQEMVGSLERRLGWRGRRR